MSDERVPQLREQYTKALRSYIETRSETALFTISKLSKQFLTAGIGPDQATEIHSTALSRIVKGLTRDQAVSAFRRSTEPLLEVMMNYAMTYHRDMENHTNELAGPAGSAETMELQKLAGLGLLMLGVISEIGDPKAAIANYVRMMTQAGDGNTEIGQAWINLIAAAIDAVQERGKLKFSTGITDSQQQEQLSLRLTYGRNGNSNGKGMSGLLAPKESVGIDIATSIAKRHEGTIKADSNTVGTTIVLMLPILDRLENFISTVRR